jgi:hexosaminidase
VRVTQLRRAGRNRQFIRSLSLDCARRWYTTTALTTLVDVLAARRYNQFRLHLSDDQAFRLESTTVTPSAQHYTKDQMATLVAYGASRGIMIVPEIDMPGHMAALEADEPDLIIPVQAGGSSLDLRNANAVPFAKSLIDEYLPVFPSPHWMIGGDEWMTGNDPVTYYGGNYVAARNALHTFFNTIGDYLISKGRIPHIWNDQITADATVPLNRTLNITCWYGPNAPTTTQLAAQGYRLVNANWDALYAQTNLNGYPTASSLSSFGLSDFAANEVVTNGVIGVQISVWTDPVDTFTEQQIITSLTGSLQALATKLWGG